MAVYIGHEPFSGPFVAASQVENRAGVYAVLAGEDRRRILELDEAANLQARLAQAEERHAGSPGLRFAVRYTPGVQRHGRERLLAEVSGALIPTPPRAP